MTVGTTNTFSLNRNQIIERAMATIGIRTDQRALTASEISEASTELNIMIKSWKTKDYLWKTVEGTLFLVSGQESYIFDGSTANATEDYVSTTTTAAAIAAASSIPVTSTTGMIIGDFIGAIQDNNTILWTTISNIVGLTVSLTSPLTYAVASGNVVYSYRTKIDRPEIINSLRVRTSTGSDIPTVLLARDSYFNIPVKNNSARPSQWYYDKQLQYGKLYLWPTPNSVSDSVNFTFQKMFFDIDAGATDPDFPIEWADPLVLNLAVRLAWIRGKGQDFIDRLTMRAMTALDEAQGYDRETASIYFQPATSENVGSYR